MKRIRNNFWVLFWGIVAASCVNQAEEASAIYQRYVHFMMYAEMPGTTRVLTYADLTTTFTVGDQVGIFAYKRTANGSDGALVMENACYSFDGNNWIPDTGKNIEINQTEALNYYAYYPYSPNIVNYKSISHQVQTDQSLLLEGNAKAYGTSDLLVAKNTTVAAGSNIVSLVFKHALSLVQVRLMGSKITDPDATVTLLNMKTTSVADLTSDDAPVTGENTSDIKMFQFDNSSNNMIYRAIVPSQSIAGGAGLGKLQIDGKSFTFSNGSDDFSLNPQKVRTVDITLNEDTQTVSFGSGELLISKWETD